jgi:hypothetical protein
MRLAILPNIVREKNNEKRELKSSIQNSQNTGHKIAVDTS